MLRCPPPDNGCCWVSTTTGIARPESPTAKDRTYLYVHNLPQRAAPVTVGLEFFLAGCVAGNNQQLDFCPGTNQRIPSQTTAAHMAASQLGAVVPHLAVRALQVADRYYGSTKFVAATATVACDRFIADARQSRVLSSGPIAPQTTAGGPQERREPVKCQDARTWGKPSATWQGVDDHGHALKVAAWSGLYYKQRRAVSLTVIRVVRDGASGKKRDPRVSWFVWIGQSLIPLNQVRQTYRRRYGQEHGFRYDKQDLLWLEPHVRTPEQYECWTNLVATARNQLVLARSEVEAQRQPWDSKVRPATPRKSGGAWGEFWPRWEHRPNDLNYAENRLAADRGPRSSRPHATKWCTKARSERRYGFGVTKVVPGSTALFAEWVCRLFKVHENSLNFKCNGTCQITPRCDMPSFRGEDLGPDSLGVDQDLDARSGAPCDRPARVPNERARAREFGDSRTPLYC